MRGLIVTSRPQYRLTWSADEWDLYSDMDGVEDVATELNEAFCSLVNSGISRDAVRSAMDRRMMEFRSFGAADTEPRYMLEDLLRAVYG